MPIAVKDFTWEESDTHLYITVPLKGVKANKVDIFSTEKYIKVHYPPYLFECFLHAAVHDQNSAAEVGNGVVHFRLEKEDPNVWSQLQCDEAGDKAVQKSMREAAIKRSQEREESKEKEKQTKKKEAEKFALHQQMKLEDEERQRIENAKTQEITKATEELERWKEEQMRTAEKEKDVLEQQILPRNKAITSGQKVDKTNEKRDAHDAHNGAIWKTAEITNSKSNTGKKPSRIFTEEAGDAPLRESGKISVNFTPRVFPTAARESQSRAEEEWLKKQADTRRIIDNEDRDLTDEEKNPVWLRDKGNSFFQSGNYQAAINAYSHAIRLNYKMPSLYSNRAASHLKLGNCMKCIEDASRALELLTPPVEQNAASRCKAHVRRGTAFCQLELYVEGLQDYEAALKINPNNEQLKSDAEHIRTIIQGSSS